MLPVAASTVKRKVAVRGRVMVDLLRIAAGCRGEALATRVGGRCPGRRGGTTPLPPTVGIRRPAGKAWSPGRGLAARADSPYPARDATTAGAAPAARPPETGRTAHERPRLQVHRADGLLAEERGGRRADRHQQGRRDRAQHALVRGDLHPGLPGGGEGGLLAGDAEDRLHDGVAARNAPSWRA